ncbi:MAG: hypothetical protein RMJ51_05265 [Candidatus Calescibacterium sp.]|nr:hypothetical protein [Candidatus Calescibacterium sp.]MCX7972478.1 hypothetical protein [bacterium]MDW8195630.1 hypothetical protein [Candidatus Calescibacterium sp.]
MEIKKNLFSNTNYKEANPNKISKDVAIPMVSGGIIGATIGYTKGTDLVKEIAIKSELDKHGIIWDKDLYKEGKVATKGQSLQDPSVEKVYIWDKEENPEAYKKLEEVVNKYKNLDSFKYKLISTLGGFVVGTLIGAAIYSIMNNLTNPQNSDK